MPIYVIYHRETGEPVHTHSEPEGMRTSREGLLAMVDRSYDPAVLEVAMVDPDSIRIDESQRMDLETGKLRAVEGELAGFGAGASSAFDLEAPTRPVQTVYEEALFESET
jgi:hypothetical protein